MNRIAINATYNAGGGQIPQLRKFLKYFTDLEESQTNITIYITQYK